MGIMLRGSAGSNPEISTGYRRKTTGGLDTEDAEDTEEF
jgi:hypothetical protein